MITWNRPKWKDTSKLEKERLMRELEDRLPEGFTYQRIEQFERYGQRLETGIFTYNDCEFVFVPGDKVTLGWSSNQWPGDIDQATLDDLNEGLSYMGIDLADAAKVLQDQMSPLREAVIGSMLVERHPHSAGWTEVTKQELNPEDHEDILKQLDIFKDSISLSYEEDQTYRLDRDGDEIRIYLFDHTEDFAQWSGSKLEKHFSILNEDDWEYLYGGGSRTLFPWGDSFDYTMKVGHFGELDRPDPTIFNLHEGDEDRPYDLELPNAFGVCFLGDPYQRELVVSKEGIVSSKGGDGGYNICGGMGIFWGYLPVATYYRYLMGNNLEWEDRLDFMNYRRIVRLP